MAELPDCFKRAYSGSPHVSYYNTALCITLHYFVGFKGTITTLTNTITPMMIIGVKEKWFRTTFGGTRTRNLRLRRPTPCLLGHEGFP